MGMPASATSETRDAGKAAAVRRGGRRVHVVIGGDEPAGDLRPRRLRLRGADAAFGPVAIQLLQLVEIDLAHMLGRIAGARLAAQAAAARRGSPRRSADAMRIQKSTPARYSSKSSPGTWPP